MSVDRWRLYRCSNGHVNIVLCTHRGDTSRSQLAELSKQANPDEIDIDDDEGGDDDEDQGPEGE